MQRERHNYAAAAELIGQALAPLEESGDEAAQADALLELAEVHQEAGRYAEADLAYQAAMEGFQAAGDRHEEARVLQWWAISAQQRRDMARAQELFERCMAIQEEIGDLAGQADTLRSLAAYEAALAGRYDQALALIERSLDIARQMPSKPAEAQALAQRGDILSQVGRFDEAQADYEQALALHQETGDEGAQVALRQSLGQVEVVRGHGAAALARYQEAVDQARASGVQSQLANALDSLAWQLGVEGRAQEAHAAAQEALALFQETGDEWGLGNVYNTLGTLETGAADYRAAREWHEQALALRRAWQDPFGEAGSLNNIGTIYTDLGDWAAAAPYFEQALEIGRRVNFLKVLTISVGNLATCWLELGQPERALGLADEALQRARDNDLAALEPELTLLQGRALQDLGRAAEARAHLERALALAVEMDLTFLWIRIETQLGILAWEQGALEEAVEHLAAAAATAERTPSPGVRWRPLFYLGRAQRDLGRREEAAASFRAAVDTLERMKAGMGAEKEAEHSFEANHGEVYRELVALLNELGQAEEAWQVLGLMKSQELQGEGQALSSASVAEGDRDALAQVQAMRARERDLERRLRAELSRPVKERNQDLLARLQQDLDEAQLHFQDYTRDLETTHPDLFQRLQVAPPSFFKLQADLLPNEAFVEPVILPDRIATFVVRGGGTPLLVRETPVDEAEVDRLIVGLRAALEDPAAAWGPTRGARALSAAQATPREDPLVTSRALFDLLIAPILPDLEGIDTLVVSPSGRLRYLPFAALWDGEQYLLERYRLALLTQAGALTEHRPMDRKSTMLALGNPDGSLPGAEQEVQALGQIWRSKDLLALLGQDATKQALRGSLEGRRILHLATHGRLLNDNPEGSYLLLAGEGAAAHLTFREIPLLPLGDVDLVVLSACQTALGEQGEGKEISGLAYQFEMRGAAAVLATLWEVDDISTTSLMSALYGELEREGGTRADLLRNSQLSLLREQTTAHPYHWAPFVLIGDWR
ncbi:MAG: CHAT domain-containing protein [Pseudomonadota bacterium]